MLIKPLKLPYNVRAIGDARLVDVGDGEFRGLVGGEWVFLSDQLVEGLASFPPTHLQCLHELPSNSLCILSSFTPTHSLHC